MVWLGLAWLGRGFTKGLEWLFDWHESRTRNLPGLGFDSLQIHACPVGDLVPGGATTNPGVGRGGIGCPKVSSSGVGLVVVVATGRPRINGQFGTVAKLGCFRLNPPTDTGLAVPIEMFSPKGKHCSSMRQWWNWGTRLP